MNKEWEEPENDGEEIKKKVESIILEFSALFERCKTILSDEKEIRVVSNEKFVEEIRRQAEFLIVENEEVLLLQKILKLSLDNIDLFNWEEITKSQKEDILYSEFKIKNPGLTPQGINAILWIALVKERSSLT